MQNFQIDPTHLDGITPNNLHLDLIKNANVRSVDPMSEQPKLPPMPILNISNLHNCNFSIHLGK